MNTNSTDAQMMELWKRFNVLQARVMELERYLPHLQTVAAADVSPIPMRSEAEIEDARLRYGGDPRMSLTIKDMSHAPGK